MKIVIFGATGQTGGQACLLAQQHVVIATLPKLQHRSIILHRVKGKGLHALLFLM